MFGWLMEQKQRRFEVVRLEIHLLPLETQQMLQLVNI
jgi:hypothetical protein